MKIIIIILAFLLGLFHPKTNVLIVQFKGIPDSIAQYVKAKISRQYNVHVEITKEWAIPKTAYDSLADKYNILPILELLDGAFYADKVIGITDKHLAEFSLFNWWGEDLFGYGEHGGQSCIISTYGMDKGAALTQEMQILATHELGHTFGLWHCNNTTCYMWEGNGETSGFAQTTHFCDSCMYKLKQLRK